MTIYLDHNATSPMRPEVREVVAALLGEPLNPSSVHAAGRKARQVVEAARKTISECIGAFPQEVVFTASATEANNWALSAFPGRRVIASAVEHPSVLKRAHILTPVDAEGVVKLDALEEMLDGAPALVSIMLANNETGVLQPLAEVAALCKTYQALLHVDAVQGLGRVPVNVSDIGADLLTFTAHKCGGPVGAAALVIKNGLDVPALLVGGGQESNRRAGTHHVPAIAGFAKAVELAQDFSHMARVAAWRDAMEATLIPLGAVVMGAGAARIPNTSCIAMPGMSAEVQLMRFDLSGICVSAGSACTSGRIEPSHVLRAMGVSDDLATTALRISAGWSSTEADFQGAVEGWKSLFHHAKTHVK